MFKKSGVLFAAVALIVLGLYTVPCLAQPLGNVTSTSKKGSLLVFAEIFTAGVAGEDTIITIANDYPDAVSVKCYWMDVFQQHQDFVFTLTAYQPVWFSAQTGKGSIDVPPFGFPEGINRGELKCWAVKEFRDPNNPGCTIENQISWNHLYGSALKISTPGIYPAYAYEYNAFAFAARNVTQGSPVITPPDTTPGNLTLNGDSTLAGYDACPSYLVFNFFAYDPPTSGGGLGAYGKDTLSFWANHLALAPCRQDLRQDSNPVCSKVKFDIWNENEWKLTGAYQCIKCWFEGYLQEIGTDTWLECDLDNLPNGKCKATGYKGTNFSRTVLKTDLGRFRVTPDTFTACKNVFDKIDIDGKTPVDVCSGFSYKTPFLGVLSTNVGLHLGRSPASTFVDTPSLAGAWNAGGATQPIPTVLWDPGTGDCQAAKR